ncbi:MULTISPECIES: hypothetical protein [Mycolicibacter]|uniref:Uncharacterized protein n=2 Tax=Mycolicibacter TaxID=1073531 RepID=A0ABU5XL67_9MYCO|nr:MULTISPECIES: hypothetical protein [unclassified Mycolicibacter]MEB3022929.1 hypothetical protein [Mycolicibacter sp. MYC098]MEB3034976.1 hypothetical protein [Mycolicibacter sp. MYC340]
MHETLQEVMAAVDDIEAAGEARRNAFDQAVGMYIDDPVTPSVGVSVWHGRVMEIQIVDEFCRRDVNEVVRIINGVIINAYAAWHTHYLQLLGENGVGV